MAQHTILLVQASNKESRIYADYETTNEALEAICHMYEQHLKQTYPKNAEITYDLAQLFEFCEQLTDLSLLIFQKSSHSYAPYDKEWVKEKLYMLLRQQCEREKELEALANNGHNGQHMEM